MYPLLRGMQATTLFLDPSRCLFPLHFHSLETIDRSMRDVIVRYGIWPIGDTVHTHLIVGAGWLVICWVDRVVLIVTYFDVVFVVWTKFFVLQSLLSLIIYVEDRPSSLHPSNRLYPSIISSNQLWSRKWQLQITCSYIQWIIQNEYFPLYLCAITVV